MKWNAFELFSPAFERTKKRVSPYNFREWLKLGFVGSLSGVSGSLGNFSSSGSSSSDSSFSGKNITFEQFRQSTLSFFQNNGLLIGVLFSIFLLFSIFVSFICSVFSFVFIELLVDKKSRINFSKQLSKGTSLFFLNLIFSSVFLLLIGALAFPYIYHFSVGNSIIDSVGVGYIIFSVLAVIFLIISSVLLTLFVNDLVTAHMYSKKVSAWFSWKEVWKMVSQNKKESFVYLLSRFVVSLAAGVVFSIIFVTLIIGELLIMGIIFLIGYLLFLLIGFQIFWFVLAIILLVVLVIVDILAIFVMLGPIFSFIRYFQLLNFEKLSGIKLLRK